jgi:hypothetical protein
VLLAGKKNYLKNFMAIISVMMMPKPQRMVLSMLSMRGHSPI